MQLIFASNNRHKFKEIKAFLEEKVQLIFLPEIGFTTDLSEDFQTFEENATQKAVFIYNKFGINCFAEDSGLEIEALNGRPGVFSARYAGPFCSDEDNINKVLQEMNGKINRKARFRAVIALIEKGSLRIFNGEVTGNITRIKRGNNGFGYDPIFQPEGYRETFAEMGFEAKNLISHRTKAIKQLADYLKYE